MGLGRRVGLPWAGGAGLWEGWLRGTVATHPPAPQEAAAIIAQRPDNPREFFKQQERVASGSLDTVSPLGHRTGEDPVATATLGEGPGAGEGQGLAQRGGQGCASGWGDKCKWGQGL